MPAWWNFYSAGRLTFGPGSICEIGRLTRRAVSGNRLFIVTDPNLVKAGIVERVAGPLREAGWELDVFAESEPEPKVATANRAVEMARQAKADGVVGIGGGSNMDLAKITAAVCAHGGQPQDYFGFDQVPGPVAPIVCVPTTAGTGSEVSHAAVLTDEANHIKVSSLSNWLRPTLAVVDPELTYSCPTKVTADSGIDALTHAVEAYTATDFDKLPVPAGEECAYEGSFSLASCIAEEAIRLVGRHLVNATTDGSDRAARDGMALAATLAGMAFSNAGVALVHALEYPMGAVLHCSHGAGNGLLLPYVMRFNLTVRPQEIARIGQLLGVENDGLSEQEAAEAGIAAVEKLRDTIGIPQRIRDLGGTREQLPAFAKKAFEIKRLMWVNPRQPTEADLLEILEAAF